MEVVVVTLGVLRQSALCPSYLLWLGFTEGFPKPRILIPPDVFVKSRKE
jgi:hypothetical protein